MATQGAFTWFNIPKLKILNNTVRLDSHAFKAALCASAQSLAASFAGASTDARYADLTAELSSANGYTAGGLALANVTLTRSTGTVTWDCDDLVWTLTGGGITFKYAVIYDNTNANKDLVGFIDMDTGGGSVSPLAGTLTLQINASGLSTLT